MKSPLEGKGRWLIAPSTLGQALAAVVAAYDGVLTLGLPAHGATTFVWLALLVIFTCTVLGTLNAARKLETLRALGVGAAPHDAAHLSRAVQEVAGAADFLFVQGVVLWVLGAAVLGAATAVLVGGGFALFGRVFSLGVLFGPLSSVLAWLWCSLRGRVVIEEIAAAGLSPVQVLATLPPKRSQIRARLVAFTAILVIVPAVLTADVGNTLAKKGVAAVMAQADPAARRAVAEAEWNGTAQKLVVLCGIVFALAMAAAYAAGTALGGPMRRVAEEASRIAKGELGKVKVIAAEDEVWSVAAAFTVMHENLAKVLTELQRAGVRIGSTTEQIVATSVRYEAGASEQASALNETSAATEELARSAAQIADNAANVLALAERTVGAARGGMENAKAFSASMGRMRQDTQAIGAAVVRLSKRVQQIGRIVEFIDAVADKSDLLALNAELEGTKAVEVGRGFSLVAGEIRRLAENVLESTSEIEGLIDEIRVATRVAVDTTEVGLSAAESSAGLADSVSAALQRIVDLAGRTSDAVRAISLATQQQQTSTGQLAEAMADILRGTQQSLAASRQVTSANVDLCGLAKDLQGAVDRFQVR